MKIYQPKVVEICELYLVSLEECKFFEEHELYSFEFAREYISDRLTEKFITGEIDNDEGIFTEEEFETILRHIIAGTLLKEMKDNGWVNSYEDDNTEEMFFLTDEGKKILKTKFGK